MEDVTPEETGRDIATYHHRGCTHAHQGIQAEGSVQGDVERGTLVAWVRTRELVACWIGFRLAEHDELREGGVEVGAGLGVGEEGLVALVHSEKGECEVVYEEESASKRLARCGGCVGKSVLCVFEAGGVLVTDASCKRRFVVQPHRLV